ncbi:hypothetical protein DFH06DRAFT_987881, partial [Mycena polygramma]
SATVVPAGRFSEDISLDEYWMVKIKEIRSTDEGEVWAKINWYYAPHEYHFPFTVNLSLIPCSDASHCARRERIYSHHSEVISAQTFEARLSIVEFLEDDPDQLSINSDEFFCRYFFDTNGPSFCVLQCTTSDAKAPIREMEQVFRCNTCICGKPYNPEDPRPGRVMHWCPRPECRQAYHRTCLMDTAHYAAMATQKSRVCARLASSADSDDPVVLPDNDTVFQLPERLLNLAAQPMVRGGVHGIAGNVVIVVRARRLVYAALGVLESCSQFLSGSEQPRIVDAEFGFDMYLDQWEAEGEFASWEEAIVEEYTGRKEGIVVLICPTCAGAV